MFDLKDLCKLTYSLGLLIQYKPNRDIFVNQSKYVKDLIHKARIDSGKPASTSCKPHNQLIVSNDTLLANPSTYKALLDPYNI